MATKNEPANSVLLKEIKAVRDEQAKMRVDLDGVIEWKRGLEIGRAAVDEYKKQQDEDTRRQLETKESKSKTEVLKQLGWVLGLIGAILTTYAVSKGIL